MPTETILRNKTAAKLVSIPMVISVVLALFCLLPRAREDRALAISIGLAAATLLVFAAILWKRVVASGRTLKMEFLPKPVHYVQLAMHSCLYAYWGWYWREVYHYAPLILAQILFVYALDMLVCWTRRERWILGFGPIPIVLSTNLFLWFKDEWFILQFVMLSIGVVAKEYVTWKREGRTAHIFNPSAVGLFIFSIILIATNSTGITWGEQIAVTLHRPPNIYLEIFVLGLVVQALFSVTLVTLSAAAMLYAMNALYTHTTGVYQFVDSNIPVSVFIGLHLLVTDPATSPRSNSGKIIFGGSYGACVFGLYSLLSTIGAPRFYDKLLCVPLLNLSVRWLDRIGYSLDRSAAGFFQRVKAPRFTWAGSPRETNFAFMAIWVVIFGVMVGTGFVTTNAVGKTHPGADPQFWAQACNAHLHKACPVWVGVLDARCEDGNGSSCMTAGQVMDAGILVPRDPKVAARELGRGCDLEAPGACQAFVNFVSEGGDETLADACDHGDAYSYFLGMLLHLGKGLPRDDVRALRIFQAACGHGYVRACGVLGDMYLGGQGTPVDTAKALTNFELSCAGHWGQSCAAAAILYHRGAAGAQNETLSQKRFAESCDLGFKQACAYVDGPVLATRTPH
jgi:hypothetical protein